MLTFIVWCILLVVCWPLAVLALILWPLVWLVLLPFRIIGFTASAFVAVIAALFFLPSRVARRNRYQH